MTKCKTVSHASSQRFREEHMESFLHSLASLCRMAATKSRQCHKLKMTSLIPMKENTNYYLYFTHSFFTISASKYLPFLREAHYRKFCFLGFWHINFKIFYLPCHKIYTKPHRIFLSYVSLHHERSNY